MTASSARHRPASRVRLLTSAAAVVVLVAACGQADTAVSDAGTDGVTTPAKSTADGPGDDAVEAPEDDQSDGPDPVTSDTAGDGSAMQDESSPAAPDDEAGFGGVELTLDTVTIVDWVEDEDVFQYVVSVDGEEQDRVFSPPAVLLADDIERSALTVAPRVVGGDLDDPVEVTSVTTEQRYVVRWEQDAVLYAYVGVTSDRGRSTSAAETPFVIDDAVEDVEVVLFGPGFTREEQDEDGVTTVTTSPPFEWTSDGHRGLADYRDLPLP